MAASEKAYPLYDSRFEHDACGIGFVAATTARERGRVLQLALAGLANLGHRGAFAADGESSDGAGVALPLEPALLRRIAPGSSGRPGLGMFFLPTDPWANNAARRIVAASLAAEGLRAATWRGRRCRPLARWSSRDTAPAKPSNATCCLPAGEWRSQP